MHDVGVPLDGVQALDLDAAELADLAQVIAAQVHQHVVLGQLLLVGQQLLFQGLVLCVGLAAGPGPGQGEGVEHAVLQLHQRLRGGTGHLYVRPGEVEHVGGGVRGPQDAVGIQQRPGEGGAEPVGEHDLEDIPLPDIMLCPLDHGAIRRLVKQRGHGAEQTARLVLLGRALQEQLPELLQLHDGLVVARLRVLQGHVHDEDDLLLHVVKGDDLVKEHQVHVLEGLGVLRVHAGGRFAVGQVVVREVADQAPGEGGQIVKLGAFVLAQDLPQLGGGVFRVEAQVPHLHLAPDAGDLQFRVIAQKRIPAPLLPLHHGLQHVAVRGDGFQHP